MFSFDQSEDVILEQKKVLEAALSSNPKTQKALQKLIRKVILEARANVVKNIKFENGDPRHSARAVRTAVYKKILGANINIYQSRKSHGTISYNAPRKLRPGQRGGNRIKVNEDSRSYTIAHYPPQDRGFILRFVNSGTKVRYAGYGRNGRTEDEYDRFILNHGGMGNRGSIAARNFFRGASERELVAAANNLATLIDGELETILNKTK